MPPQALRTPGSGSILPQLTALWCAVLALATTHVGRAAPANERQTDEPSSSNAQRDPTAGAHGNGTGAYWALATGEGVCAETQFSVVGTHSPLHLVFTDRGRLMLGTPEPQDERLHWIPVDEPRRSQAWRPQALAVCGQEPGLDGRQLYAISSQHRLLRRALTPGAIWQDLGEAPDGRRLICEKGGLIAQSADGRRWGRAHAPGAPWLHADALALQSDQNLALLSPSYFNAPERVREGLEAIAARCARPARLSNADLSVAVDVSGSSITVRDVGTAPAQQAEDPELRRFGACLEEQFEAAMTQRPALVRGRMLLTLRPLLSTPHKILLQAGGRSVSVIKLNTPHANTFRILGATSSLQQLSLSVTNGGREARLYIWSPQRGAKLKGTITLQTDLPGLPVSRIAVEQTTAPDGWERWSSLLGRGRRAQLGSETQQSSRRSSALVLDDH